MAVMCNMKITIATIEDSLMPDITSSKNIVIRIAVESIMLMLGTMSCM